ncbi:MAG: LacI family DNA-binding transcriptional regulator [Microbacterium sp.]|uniref:LacI family DNA-binding transcriptional regulator n=1 Tax=Microbacterium sp. TaxID=51671 RepID=UPI003F813E58
MIEPRSPSHATLEDVATLAGVSRSTASRVLTGSAHVSANAVTAVHEAVKALGYVPDPAARALAMRRGARDS